jgi:uncharacterized protein (DUF4415 family)
MGDEKFELSDMTVLTPEMFANAVVLHGLKREANKAVMTIRVDQDVLTWFKAQGRGYQTRINSLLRAYMEASLKQKRIQR